MFQRKIAILYLVISAIAFVIFYRRARTLGEDRKIFWGFTGAAAFIVPPIVAGLLIESIAAIFDSVPDSLRVITTLAGLIAGFGVAKWALNSLLPLPKKTMEERSDGIADDK